MSVGLNNSSVYTDFQGLTELKTGARKQTQESIRETARQFESLFLQMMLKNMRAASLGEGLMDNDQSKLYTEMFDQQVALDMSKGQGIGLADMLVKQLGGTSEASGDAKATELNPQSLRRALKSYGADPVSNEFSADSPQAFIQQLWPHAKKAANELGVDPRALVAQAALETGWGQSMISRDNGSNSLNFFGIKAGSSWTGEKVSSVTHEYQQGQRQVIKDDFRAYSSIEASFADYVSFIKDNPRYNNALQAGANNDVGGYASGLQKAGYATDPEYANKIKDIVDRSTFVESIASLQDVSRGSL